MRSKTIVIGLFGLLLLGSERLSALSTDVLSLDQEPASDQGKRDIKPSDSNKPSVPSLTNVAVCEVHKLGYKSKEDDVAGLGDMITLYVRDLESLTRAAKCLSKADERVDDYREQQIALYLDGRKIKGLVPESGGPRIQAEPRIDCGPGPAEIPIGILQFHLERTADSDEAWSDILGGPGLHDLFIRPTDVSAGLENDFPVRAIKDKKFGLIRIHKFYFVFSVLGVLSMAFLLVRLAATTPILRDMEAAPRGKKSITGEKSLGPYSLARCQMAWWLFWVVASYLFIWLVTGGLDIITVSTLTLLGIGVGTALGSAVVEAGRNQSSSLKFKSLTAERKTLAEEIATVESQIKSTKDSDKLTSLQDQKRGVENRISFIDDQLGELSESISPRTTRGFIPDLLSEKEDMSFHRFQMFVWTIVLTIIFLSSVYRRLSMPEFSATLLGLQGIAAGTYLGFKFPGK